MSPPIPMYPTSTVTRTKHSGFPTHQQPNIAHRLLPQPGTSYHPFNPSLIPMPGPSTHHPYANSRQVWPINLALQHAGPNAPQSPLLYPSLPFPTPPPPHTPNPRPTVTSHHTPMGFSPAQWGPHSSKPSPGQNSVSHQQTIPIYLPLLIPTQLEILFFRLV